MKQPPSQPNRPSVVAVLTTRLGPIAASTALGLREYGIEPMIIIMGRRSSEGSNLKTLGTYGTHYVLQRMGSWIWRRIWLLAHQAKIKTLPVRELRDVDWQALSEVLEEVGAAATVTASFGHKVPAAVILHHRNMFNIHPAPLPEWRGADPIFWMLKWRERSFCVTLHSLSERIDEGDVFATARFESPPPNFHWHIENRLASLIRAHVGTWIDGAIRNTISPHPQVGGRYWPLPTLANQATLSKEWRGRARGNT